MEKFKQYIQELQNPDILKREYDRITDEVEKRVGHIWRELCRISNRKMDYYCFTNDYSDNQTEGGSFDVKECKEFIELIGCFRKISSMNYDYNNGFPTRFLWMEDEEWIKEVKANLEECKRAEKLEKSKKKERKEYTVQITIPAEVVENLKNKINKK